MLNKILRSFRDTPPPPATVPDGLRIYAVGDIHGRLDLLETLIAAIDADDQARGAARSQLIFLGDVVDRGPDSAGVIDRLIALTLERPETRFLLGNHEEVFLEALGGSEKVLKFFCRIGGRETILSYGISEDEYNLLSFEELGARIAELVPATHREFLARFEDMIVVGDYVFVHAGIRPGVALDEQKPSDLRWIRERFLDHRGDHEKVVVHGHTISDTVDMRSARIGVDTGGYATGILSALGLEGSERWVINT